MKIMFLCTGNTCRSQMAEGLAIAFGKGRVEAFSAGIKAEGFVHPRAINAMKEIGIDISGQRSKAIDPALLNQMDLIVTLCGHADETCPVTPANIRKIHVPIDDPSKTEGTEEEKEHAFRNARDEIKEKISGILKDISDRSW